MRLIFAGTPEFAAAALASLHQAGHEIALVLTQPDRPAGRGMKLQTSSVKQFALAHHLPLVQPHGLRLDGRFAQEAALAREAIMAARAEAMVVAAYGLILPQWVLDAPARGCLNIHASLLPRWRGAAPIHRAIEAGDAATGVTIMQMDAGLDTGDMLMSEAVPITGADTTASLHDRLATLGGRMIVQALEIASAGRLMPVKQPTEGVTYAHKIEKSEATIDWSLPAEVITRRVRAFNPFPGAATWLGGEMLKVWAASPSSVAPAPSAGFGEIVSVAPELIGVAAMNSIVNVLEVQRPGGKRLGVAEFLRGNPLRAGMHLGRA